MTHSVSARQDVGGGCDPYFKVNYHGEKAHYSYKKDKTKKVKPWRKGDGSLAELNCKVFIALSRMSGNFQCSFAHGAVRYWSVVILISCFMIVMLLEVMIRCLVSGSTQPLL
jgi:hypothetical protein